MSRLFRLMAVAAVASLALSAPALAAQAKPATAKAAKAMTVKGTLQKVDGQNLTIKTVKGTQEVMLGSDAKIRRDGKTLTSDELNAATGSRVTIRYKEDNGHKMAESVTLAAGKAAAPKQVASAKGETQAKGTKK